MTTTYVQPLGENTQVIRDARGLRIESRTWDDGSRIAILLKPDQVETLRKFLA